MKNLLGLLELVGFYPSVENLVFSSILLFAVVGSLVLLVVERLQNIKKKQEQKIQKERKQREIARQFKLRAKKEQFEAFKHLIETYDREVNQCVDCYEFNFTQYVECNPNDYDGLQRFNKSKCDLKKECKMIPHQSRGDYQSAYTNIIDDDIKNLRVTLQDFTVEEVAGLYSL